MSEHRESFEKGNADADPVEIGGRLASCGKKSPSPGKQDVKSEKSTAGVRRSSGDGMCAEETRRNTGDPPRRGKRNSTGDPRGEAGPRRESERFIIARKRVTSVERRSLSSKAA
jgi:hypothetical protein